MRRWAPDKATGPVPSAIHLWFPGYEADAPPIAEVREQTVKSLQDWYRQN